jgi:hypothetical protein
VNPEDGLPFAQSISDALDVLSELHRRHYARYPDNQAKPVPEISFEANTVVDWLLSTITPRVQP